MLRRSFLSGLVSLSGTPTSATGERVERMKIAMQNGLPVTSMFVNGKGPYIALIDTGNASAYGLRAGLLNQIGLRNMAYRELSYGRVYGDMKEDRTPVYYIEDLIVGNVAHNNKVLMMGPDHFPGGFDGVVATSIFTIHPADMDFLEGEVVFHLGGSIDRTGFRRIGCDLGSDGLSLVVPVEVEGVAARLAVVTGSPITAALYPEFVRRNGLWDRHPRYMPERVPGAIGSARLVRTPSLKIGPFRFRDAVISISDPSQRILSDVDGYIGMELLRRFTLGIDVPGVALWLKPGNQLADPFLYDFSGLGWDWTAGGPVVVSIGPGSPAEAAGVRAGDRLAGFSDRDAANLWAQRLKSAVDNSIALEISRDGRTIPTTLTLRDWL